MSHHSLAKIGLVLLFSLSRWAFADKPAATSPDDMKAAALQTLVQLSGRPESDISPLLADCAANQMSMDVCAWRDQIVADSRLQKVVAEKKLQAPSCAAKLDATVAAWQKKRDAVCAKAAAKDFGGGSMEPTAKLVCTAVSTADYTSKLSNKKMWCAAN